MSRRNIAWDDWMSHLGEADEVLMECEDFFVYGSLQSHGWNNPLLSTAYQVDSRAITQDKYVLGNVGFPYAFPKHVVPEQHYDLLFPVQGEVWRVTENSTVLDLDRLEGHPNHYEREIVTLADGTKAWMYLQKDWYLAGSCEACHLDEGVWKWRDNY